MNFIKFSRFYFDLSRIFSDLFPYQKCKKGLFNDERPAKLTWHKADTWWSHVSPRGCLRGGLPGTKSDGLAVDGPTG